MKSLVVTSFFLAIFISCPDQLEARGRRRQSPRAENNQGHRSARCMTITHSYFEKCDNNRLQFENGPCKSSSGSMGTCYTDNECTQRGGKTSGTCAQGFGMCCLFEVGCGGLSNENNTVFSYSGSGLGTCKASVCKVSNDICQLRLDFDTFKISGPEDSTEAIGESANGALLQDTGVSAVKYTATGQCLYDRFAVTSPGNPTPPIICGLNSKQHMYVDASAFGCNDLIFDLGSGGNVAEREWTVQVTQYSCDYEDLAPKGCTKYFSGKTSGELMTYNFAEDGVHLANQREKFCIRRESGAEQVCVFAEEATDFDLSDASDNAGQVGTESKCCGYGKDGDYKKGYDCLLIPGASADGSKLSYDEFCGGGSLASGFFTKSGPTTSVCTKNIPFTFSFYSDATELEEEGNELTDGKQSNRGFKLQFIMK